MSPEQVDTKRFGKVDGRADVYALGVIGYQLVTGRLPYEVDYQSQVAIARAVTDEEPLPPARINKRLRGDLSTILLKALEKEPARRYQTADAMAADLTSYLERRPIAARPSGAVYRAKRFAQRNPGLVGGVTAAFAALLLGLIGTATGLYSASTARRETRVAAADLAMNGGNWPKAMQYIDAPTSSVSPDDLPELLTRIKAADYAEDVAEADRLIRLARESLRDAAPAELDLAEANLLLSASADFDSALTLVDRAKTKGLAAPADRHYVDGLLAKTTPQALAAFQRAIEADSRHFPAQRAALVCRFFLGQHDKVLQQSEVVRNLFPNESLGRQLAIVSGAFLPGPYGEHPRLSELADMLGKINPLADETDVLGLIDMGAQFALKDKADANSWALFHAAIQPMQDATKKGSDSLTPLQNVFSGGSRGPVDVSFATLYVPVIARARSEFEAVMMDYQAANYAADTDMVDRIEAALKVHPESTMFLVAGSIAVSLPQGSVSEMAQNVERSQAFFQKGAESYSIVPEIPIESRVWAIMGQHALGRPGRKHDKPDLAMRDNAIPQDFRTAAGGG